MQKIVDIEESDVSDMHIASLNTVTSSHSLYFVTGDTRHRISGRAPISELNDSLKLNLPVCEAHTLAGFLINRLRHIPEVGDTVLEQGYRYTVTEADARSVTKVRVERV